LTVPDVIVSKCRTGFVNLAVTTTAGRFWKQARQKLKAEAVNYQYQAKHQGSGDDDMLAAFCACYFPVCSCLAKGS
jgi:hypothetical protein